MIFARQICTGAVCAIVLGILAGCGSGNADRNASLGDALRQLAVSAIPGGKSEAAPAPEKTDQQKAAEALRVNPDPLILVNLEKQNRSQVLAMTGQNGTMRTYMTPNRQALIMRRGMLTGTRGLGNDLSVAEPGTEALIRNGQAGQATRIMRYYTGDGLETPLRFECVTRTGPRPGVMTEKCRGHGISFENSYMTAGGNITVSRQWIGPASGYITIQTLRP